MLVGIDSIVDAIEKFIDESKTSYDVCVDSSIPSFIVKYGIMKKFLDFKKKNGHIRYITDVTSGNISYCKQIMKAASIRHLEGLKATFRVNQAECHCNIVLDEPRQMAIMIRSKTNEIVSQYQNVFNILWEKAIPIKEKIREIEDIGNVPRITNEEKLNSQIDDRNKNPPQPPHIKIQLWSNRSKSDYAIKLKARTDTPLQQPKIQRNIRISLKSQIILKTSNTIGITLSGIGLIFTPVIQLAMLSSLFRMIQQRSQYAKCHAKKSIRKMPRQNTQNATPKCNYCKMVFNTEISRTR